MEYEEAFKIRAFNFLNALQMYPNVLIHECEKAASMTRGNVIVNLAEAGVNIGPFLPETVNYISFELNQPFAKLMNIEHCSVEHIPLESSFADTIIVVATLHHMTQKERQTLYKECWRVLKPNGRLVIGDIRKGSPQAKWLDEYVHQNNPFGHIATFFDESDRDVIHSEGFQVEIVHAKYPWVFQSQKDMEIFMRELFYITKTQTTNLNEYFSIHENLLEWELLYFIGTKVW